MKIERSRYLEQLIRSRENGVIKIITGIRRCGKSFLLNVLFREYLEKEQVAPEQIISLSLEDDINIRYRNPLELGKYFRERVTEINKTYFLLIDEIQMVEPLENPYLPKGKGDLITFVDVLNGLNKLPNVDIYVTGSNSKMLSSDILTTFRDRGQEIHISPLTYDEFYPYFPGDKRHAWREFFTFGGMPKILQKETIEEKSKYLKDLFSLVYIKDIIERNNLKANKETLDELLNTVASSVGSLSNPTRIANTFISEKGIKVKNETISNYLDCFIDAFVLERSYRYDIKGRSYIDTPLKYYFTDVGLRNARLNFRQQEENHIMENVLFNELTARGFNVDVGVVEYNYTNAEGKKVRSQLEVDFIVHKTDRKYYIQSALTVAEESKRVQEINSLNRINDSYAKIVIVKDDIIPWTDDNGVQYINIEDFLLNKINEL